MKAQRTYSSQTCAWCAGTGSRPLSVGYVVSCLVCGGKGKVLVAQPSGPCRQCEGGGRRNLNSACLACAGTGWVGVVK